MEIQFVCTNFILLAKVCWWFVSMFPTRYLFLHTQKRPRQLLAREEFCTKKYCFSCCHGGRVFVIQENVTKL